MHSTTRNFIRTNTAAAAPQSDAGSAGHQTKRPLNTEQVPGVIRRKVGSFEVTALLDGYMAMPPELFSAPEEEARQLSAARFEDGRDLSPVNAFVINLDDRIVLVDTGAADAFGPTLGKLPAALKAAGYETGQINAIVMTHMHPDHIAGAIDQSGKAVFQNAELILTEADFKYWHDDACMSAAPEPFRPFFLKARQAASAYAGRTTQINGEAEIFSALRAVPLPGHTPGHTGYIINSGDDSLYIWGDTIHHATFQLAHPEWGPAFDVDAELAIKSRKRSLDMAAADKLMIAGMHMPFPATGHVTAEGEGYRFVAAEWPYAL
ncbi:MBL fold metallo-hydrolase [Agrobacterium sp. MOPV5]|uniref:MBL fold metallo-hydrolase n=1 Tax=Agrobacterium leguminum TaxID=2792015 RepID=UPI0018C234D3|nr:MBL fold metallo-hydrolase [Agrobacterium leguminum]MBG0512132.1 MBL fold metallo-hydrolase [Agrobacterium leguminum]